MPRKFLLAAPLKQGSIEMLLRPIVSEVRDPRDRTLKTTDYKGFSLPPFSAGSTCGSIEALPHVQNHGNRRCFPQVLLAAPLKPGKRSPLSSPNPFSAGSTCGSIEARSVVSKLRGFYGFPQILLAAPLKRDMAIAQSLRGISEAHRPLMPRKLFAFSGDFFNQGLLQKLH